MRNARPLRRDLNARRGRSGPLARHAQHETCARELRSNRPRSWHGSQAHTGAFASATISLTRGTTLVDVEFNALHRSCRYSRRAARGLKGNIYVSSFHGSNTIVPGGFVAFTLRDQIEIVLHRGRGEHRVDYRRSMAARPLHLGGNLSAMSNFRIAMPGKKAWGERGGEGR